jgi:hypothetical protein
MPKAKAAAGAGGVAATAAAATRWMPAAWRPPEAHPSR